MNSSSMKSQLDRAARSIRRAAARGVAEGAQLLADRVRHNAPVESGALRDSVGTGRGERSRDRVEELVSVEGGHGAEPVALHVEYGTEDEPPDPFVRRSVGQTRRRVEAAIAGAVRRAVGGG